MFLKLNEFKKYFLNIYIVCKKLYVLWKFDILVCIDICLLFVKYVIYIELYCVYFLG